MVLLRVSKKVASSLRNSGRFGSFGAWILGRGTCLGSRMVSVLSNGVPAEIFSWRASSFFLWVRDFSFVAVRRMALARGIPVSRSRARVVRVWGNFWRDFITG